MFLVVSVISLTNGRNSVGTWRPVTERDFADAGFSEMRAPVATAAKIATAKATISFMMWTVNVRVTRSWKFGK